MLADKLSSIALMTQWTRFDSGAERVALALAERARVPLTVVVPLLSNPEFEVVAHDLVAEAEAETARAAADFEARASAAGVPAELRVRRGDELWREVVEEARSERVDLLVTRRRGHRGFLGKLRLGEMVREIAARGPCPVLLVPREAAVPARRALVAVDSQRALDTAVPPAVALAAALGLSMELLVCAPAAGQGAQQLQRAESLGRAANVTVDGTVESAALADSVAARMSSASIDLLVLAVDPERARHGRLGDAVEAIVGATACATLLVRPQEPLG